MTGLASNPRPDASPEEVAANLAASSTASRKSPGAEGTNVPRQLHEIMQHRTDYDTLFDHSSPTRVTSQSARMLAARVTWIDSGTAQSGTSKSELTRFGEHLR